MEIHISRKDAQNEAFLNAQLRFADLIGAVLVIDCPVEKPKPYDCVLWQDENNDSAHAEFDRKTDALKWAEIQLRKHPTAVIDLKKWNAKGDDYEDWQYRMVDGRFTEVDGFGW